MVNYWGFIYINFGSERLYFDDGLVFVVFLIVLFCVKEVLNFFFELCFRYLFFKIKFWYNIECFKWFGVLL